MTFVDALGITVWFIMAQLSLVTIFIVTLHRLQQIASAECKE